MTWRDDGMKNTFGGIGIGSGLGLSTFADWEFMTGRDKSGTKPPY